MDEGVDSVVPGRVGVCDCEIADLNGCRVGDGPCGERSGGLCCVDERCTDGHDLDGRVVAARVNLEVGERVWLAEAVDACPRWRGSRDA